MKVLFLLGLLVIIGTAFCEDIEEDSNDEVTEDDSDEVAEMEDKDPSWSNAHKVCYNKVVGQQCSKVKQCNTHKGHYGCRYVKKCKNVYRKVCSHRRCYNTYKHNCRVQKVCHPKYFYVTKCRYLPKCYQKNYTKRVCGRHCAPAKYLYGKRTCYNKCYNKKYSKTVCKRGRKLCYKAWASKKACKYVKTCWKEIVSSKCRNVSTVN